MADLTTDGDPVADAARTAMDALRSRAHGHVALLAVTGSRAYGTHRPDSDVDLRGFYVAPPASLLGLHRPAEQHQMSDPDVVCYELGKFVHLAAKANPVVLEALFSPQVLHSSPAGQLVRARGHVLLSRQAQVTYGGYATSQLKRVQDGRADAGEMGRRRVKHLLHTFRLLEQGRVMLATGHVAVAVDDPAALAELARAAADDLTLAEREFETRLARLDAAAERSPLRERPDPDLLHQLVLDVRAAVDPALASVADAA